MHFTGSTDFPLLSYDSELEILFIIYSGAVLKYRVNEAAINIEYVTVTGFEWKNINL